MSARKTADKQDKRGLLVVGKRICRLGEPRVEIFRPPFGLGARVTAEKFVYGHAEHFRQPKYGVAIRLGGSVLPIADVPLRVVQPFRQLLLGHAALLAQFLYSQPHFYPRNFCFFIILPENLLKFLDKEFILLYNCVDSNFYSKRNKEYEYGL